jgi:phosphomannomutase / phosphoglucomutase
MIHSHIFRAYDIRGVFEKDFDLTGAEEIGKAYGTYLIRTSPNVQKPLSVCVGRDGRVHSEDIQNAFMRGLLFVGIKVVDIGLAFSPLLFYSICKGRFDGGVNITASHNPKEYNGFKLQRDFAHAICGDEIQEILQILETKDFIIGEEEDVIQQKNYWKEYRHTMKELMPHLHREKIVIDAGSGVTGAFAPELFTELGYEVVPLYCEVDGNFPYHQPDPEDPVNLQDLQKKVLEEKASMGIAFDGDGDRVGIVDSRGVIYSADFILLLLLQDVLKRNKGSSVVYTVNSSMLIKNEIIRLGGTPVELRVGHSFVEKKMRETQALLGGESSGHMFMAENYYGYDDAFLAALHCLSIVFSSEKPLKEHFEHLPKTYMSPEIKFVVDDNEKFIVIEKLVEYFKQSSYKYTDIDGIKVYFEDDSWGICRASNTSPKISIICEAKDEKTANKISCIMQEAIEPFLS